MRRLPGTILVTLALTTAGCGGSKMAGKTEDPPRPQPITVQTPDIRVTWAGVLKEGDEGTLVKNKGWREYVLEIQNLTTDDLTVKDVRLLNPTGRYIESAASYGQIIVPPNTATAVAEDVAKTGAGIAAGAIIPYGGYLVSVLTSATSTAFSGTKGSAERTFAVRVLKGVELAAGGKVAGSAFLPDIPGSRALVIDYAKAHGNGRVEIPLRRPGNRTAGPSGQGQAPRPAAQAPSPQSKPTPSVLVTQPEAGGTQTPAVASPKGAQAPASTPQSPPQTSTASGQSTKPLDSQQPEPAPPQTPIPMQPKPLESTNLPAAR